MVTESGDLIDPNSIEVPLEKGIMTRQLYRGLKQQGVDFDEDYRKWSREAIIKKMAHLMGKRQANDPDETYVLTVDNLIKIMAIEMRFRYTIIAAH